MRLTGAIIVLVLAGALLYLNLQGLENDTATIRGIPVLVGQAGLQVLLLLITIPLYQTIFNATWKKAYSPADGLSTLMAGCALLVQLGLLVSLALYGPTRSRATEALAQFGDATLERSEKAVLMHGVIGENAGRRAIALYHEKPFETLVITSPGGLLDTAIKLGAFIRENRITVVVISHCESACAIIAFSSPYLMADDKASFGFHQGAATVRDDNSLIRMTDRIATKTYVKALTDLGVPADIIAKAQATPPDDMFYVSASDLYKRNLVKELIELDE